MYEPSKQSMFKAAAFAAIFAAGVVAGPMGAHASQVNGTKAAAKCIKAETNGRYVWKCKYRDTSQTAKSFNGGLVSVRNNTKVSVGVGISVPKPPAPAPPPQPPPTITVVSVTPNYEVVDDTWLLSYSAGSVGHWQNGTGYPTIQVNGYNHETGETVFLYELMFPELTSEKFYYQNADYDAAMTAFFQEKQEAVYKDVLSRTPGATTGGTVEDLEVFYGPLSERLEEVGWTADTPNRISYQSNRVIERQSTKEVPDGTVTVTYSDHTTAVVPYPGPAIGSPKT